MGQLDIQSQPYEGLNSKCLARIYANKNYTTSGGSGSRKRTHTNTKASKNYATKPPDEEPLYQYMGSVSGLSASASCAPYKQQQPQGRCERHQSEHHDAPPTEKLALSPPLSPTSLQPNQDPQNEALFNHELIFCVVLYRIPNSTLGFPLKVTFFRPKVTKKVK